MLKRAKSFHMDLFLIPRLEREIDRAEPPPGPASPCWAIRMDDRPGDRVWLARERAEPSATKQIGTSPPPAPASPACLAPPRSLVFMTSTFPSPICCS